MSFNLTVGKKDIEIKFNYGLVFRLNKALETEQGADNGAGIVFSRLKSGDDSALHDIIKVISGKNTPDEAILNAVGEQAELLGEGDEGAGLDKLINMMVEEIEKSGFFMRKLHIFKENVEKAKAQLKPAQKDEQAGLQAILDTLVNVH
ncbi:tail assembly chaperone [Lactococcus petauri]|uniref:tail assembly chaperone n=1 Tax=Lactococcus petauri TaxID=1940789 RepID=UPI0022E6F62A|nr:tail assembly chaperone [Lactococcus petauri]